VNGHVFDELPQLLTGEADRATVAAVSTHLRGCEDCREELIAAIAAHAALMSAAKYAPELAEAGRTPSALQFASDDLSPIPDLSAVFAQIRGEVDDRATTTRQPRQSRRIWLVAAAAVLVLGLGGTGAYLATSGSSQPSRALSLQAFDEGTSSASAKLIGSDQMTLDASSLPALPAGRYYEVWLTNGARTSMAPVGLLAADRTARFTIPSTEMSSYAAVEVSVQDTSGVGTYSGHSVLRGTYA
jgi:Anti-sigma-K factor rskA